MFKNKLFMFIIAMLIAITLILGTFFLLWNFMDKKDQSADPNEAAKNSVSAVEGKKLTSAQVKEQTVEIKEILTNLADKDRVVKASFAFELDNKKAKAEFEDLNFKMKGIVNQTLSDMKAEQIQGSKGQEYLISVMMNKINGILSQGKLKQIWVTDFIVQ